MVKRTNRIHNLNKMIQEYKREQEKFEVIQQDIQNQQKQIEDLRLLILSTNFMNKDSTSSSSIVNTSTPISSKHSTSIKNKEMNRKEIHQDNKKDLKIKNKIKTTPKVFQDDQLNSSKLKELNNEQAQMNNQLNKNSTRSKGLQTVNKNVLNQKDTKYFNDKYNSKLSSKSTELKNDYLIKKNDEFFKKADDLVKLISSESTTDQSNDLALLTTGKHLNKFENQENPINDDGLGLNIISKSINKKARQIKSNSLKPTKLTNSTNRLHFL